MIPPSVSLAAGRATDVGTCVTCGELADTAFCPYCGERRASDRPLRIRAVLEEAWDEFAAIDGRVIRSFWTLLRRPGALTLAYVRGERLRYLTPLKLFLLVNVLYFVQVSTTHADTLTTPLAVHLDATFHRDIAQHLVRARLATRRVTLAQYAPKFDAAAATQAKTLVVALVPLFAVLIALVEVRRRRPAIQHVAFAFHAMSVLLLGQVVLVYGWIAAMTAYVRLRHPQGSVKFDDGAFSVVLSLGLWLWVTPGLRRTYGDGWIGAACKGAALTYGVLPVLYAYRLLLFFIAFWVT